MQESLIREQVQQQVGRWTELPFRGRGVEVTQGAVDTLSFMIRKIETDRSARWRDFSPDLVQRQAISLIPNVLNDIARQQRLGGNDRWQISSWELWHGISGVLDRWCTIEKD